jgi:hypothetical protein
MPDEHDRWLDRETAERLLRGERLGAEDPGPARDLARMLDSLSAGPAGPAADSTAGAAGEDAAVAAFRSARAARPVRAVRDARLATGADAPDTPGAARPVRDLTRRGRAAARHRFVLTAALVTGVVGGGVAIGGGLHGFVSGDGAPAGSVATGVPLPTGTSTPVPLGSESPAAGLPGGVLSGITGGVGVRPSPGGEDRGSSDDTGHEDAPGAAGPGDGKDDEDGAGNGPGSPDGRSAERGHGKRESLREACRDHLAGRPLTAEQRRRLEAAAGSAGVAAYCAGQTGDGDGEAPADGSLKRDDDRDGGEREAGGSDEGGHREAGGPVSGQRGREHGAGNGAGNGAGRDRETPAGGHPRSGSGSHPGTNSPHGRAAGSGTEAPATRRG